mmetsp:Transcript_53009/g.107733  ORF Transcript_53009/g.107733 Transcript_53009/m.107733 type:complete len:734 (+) Transcript_53009:89-2290(+)
MRRNQSHSLHVTPRVLGLVHRLDVFHVLLVDDGALQLHRIGELVAHLEVLLQDVHDLHVRGTGHGLGVGSLAHLLQARHPAVALIIRGHSARGGRGGATPLLAVLDGDGGQVVGRAASLRVLHALQRDKRHQELLLVAVHDEVGDGGALLLEGLLDEHRGDVLAASADDQLLVAAGDAQEAVFVDQALVATVQEAVAVDGLAGLLGVLHVTHHDVAPAVHDLTLAGRHALQRLVDGVRHHGHDRALHGRAGGAQLVHAGEASRVGVVHGLGPGALGLAEHLVDGHRQVGEEREGGLADGGGASGQHASLAQADGAVDLAEHQLVREAVHEGLVAAAAVLDVLGHGGAAALGPVDELLLDAGGSGAGLGDGLDGGLHLLPHARDAEEDGGLARVQPRLQLALEGRDGGEVHLGTGDHGAVHIQHLRRDVRQRQVRHQAVVVCQGERLLQHRAGRPRHVVVAHHHGLWRAGGARRVDERAAVARQLGGDARLHTRLVQVHVLTLAERHELVPAVHLEASALGLEALLQDGVDDVVVHDDGLQVGRHVRVQQRRELLQLHLVLHHRDLALGVVHDVRHCLRGVGGVDACGHAAGGNAPQVRHQPVAVVEAEDVHGGERSKVDRNQRARERHALVIVLAPGPRVPRAAGDGLVELRARHVGQFHPVQGGLVSELLDSVAEHLHHREARGVVTRSAGALRCDAVGFSYPPAARCGEAITARGGASDVSLGLLHGGNPD